MKYLLLLSVISYQAFSAEITTSSDRMLKINQGCSSRDILKKTIILVDETVDNKNSLILGLEGLEQRISSVYKSDDRDYLLNHKFELAKIDDSGEHAAAWSVQTPKELGSKSSHLTNSLVDLKTNLDKSITEIKNDKNVYSSSLLLEQVSNYSKNLSKCDNLIVISDLLLVDSENNFEKGKFTKPMNLEATSGNITLLRVEKKGMPLREIKKVESWWIESLNGGSKFSKNYSLNSPAFKINNKPKVLKRKSNSEARNISSTNEINKKDLNLTDEVVKTEASPEKVELLDSKPEEAVAHSAIDSVNFSGDAPIGLEYPNLKPTSNCAAESEGVTLSKSKIANTDEDGEGENVDNIDIDGLGGFGIIITEDDLKETPKKPTIIAPPSIPEKKVVDMKLLQLSCNEFTGRLVHEAFPLCNIGGGEIMNSKIELTINENGRINSFDNSNKLTEGKKLCLSGYVASKPAENVGAEFTCRVVIQ